MEREAEELRAPCGTGRAMTRQVDRLLRLPLIHQEAHALPGDPRVVRRALGERRERVDEEGARLTHLLAHRGTERGVAIEAFVRLLPLIGGIPVRTHRAPAAVMNHA